LYLYEQRPMKTHQGGELKLHAGFTSKIERCNRSALYSESITNVTHYRGGWVGNRASSDIQTKRKITDPAIIKHNLPAFF